MGGGVKFTNFGVRVMKVRDLALDWSMFMFLGSYPFLTDKTSRSAIFIGKCFETLLSLPFSLDCNQRKVI